MFPTPLVQLLKPESGKNLNWIKMFQNLLKDFNDCTLIWNQETRNELKEILEHELDIIYHDVPIEEIIPWEYENFSVFYKSPKDLQVGIYYIGLLNEELKKNKEFQVEDPDFFVKQLYDSLMIQDDHEIILKILTTMYLVITKNIDLFKKFEHMNPLIWFLDSKRSNNIWLETLLLLLKKLFIHPYNIKIFVEYGGIPILIDHLSDFHSSSIKFERETKPNTPNYLSITINILALIEAITSIPRYRKNLTSPEHFPYIVQSLMVNKPEITNQVIVILLTLVGYCLDIQPVLYETGIFHFIMKIMSNGCTELISLFLKKYHNIQDVSKSQSFLLNFLPECLIVLLDKEKGEKLFTLAMNKDTCDPYLIWSKSHREKMVGEVNELLESFKNQLEKNPKTLYKYTPLTPIIYDSNNEIYIENVYVRLYNKYPQSEILDPEHFLNGLIVAMKEDKTLLSIITAQKNLYKKYSNREFFLNYPGFTKLIEFIEKRLDLQITDETIELYENVTGLICTIFENSEQNKNHFIKIEKGMDVLLKLLEKSFDQLKNLSKVVYNILHTFQIISTKLIDYIYQKPQILEILQKYFIVLNEFTDISFESIKIINNLSKFDSLHKKMILHGNLISLLNIAVIFTSESDSIKDEACLTSIITISNFIKNEDVVTFLKQCLTDNLYYMMVENPKEFFIQSRKDIHTPQIIWNSQTRNELKEFLKEEIKKIGSWKVPAFAYKCLEEELMIDRLYISALKIGSNLSIEHPGKFLEKIINCISDDTVSLSKDNSDNIIQSILRKLKLKLEAIKSLLKEHKDTLKLSDYQYINIGPIYSVLFEMIRLETNKNLVLTCLFEVLLMFSQDGIIWKYSKSLYYYHKLLHSIKSHHELIFEILIETCLKYDDATLNAITTGVIISALYEISTIEEGISRTMATKFIGSLVMNKTHGDNALQLLIKILMNRFMSYLQKSFESPELFLEFFDEDHYAPDIVWNKNVRKDLINYLKKEMEETEKSFKQNQEHTFNFEQYPRPSLTKELLVGDIFIKSFNENPYFKVLNPEKLLMQLFTRLSDELSEYIKSSDFSTPPEDLISIFIALKNLITSSQSLLIESNKYLKTIVSFIKDYEEDEKVTDSGLSMLSEVVKSEVAIQYLMEEKYIAHLLSYVKKPLFLKNVLNVISEMVKHSEFILQFKAVGGVLYLLKILLTEQSIQLKELSAGILSQMVSDSKYGSQMNEYICFFLTAKFGSKFESRTDKFVEFFEGSHETSGKFKKKWNDETKKELLSILERSIKEFELEKNWNGKERFNVEIISSIYSKKE